VENGKRAIHGDTSDYVRADSWKARGHMPSDLEIGNYIKLFFINGVKHCLWFGNLEATTFSFRLLNFKSDRSHLCTTPWSRKVVQPGSHVVLVSAVIFRV
jgi:hypothetical protein